MTMPAAKLPPKGPRERTGGPSPLDGQFDQVQKAENRLLTTLVVVSALAHIGVMGFSGLSLWKKDPIVLEDEGAIAADLVTDFEPQTAPQSARPDVTVKGEMAVPQNMLPQLPKSVKVEQPPPPEEAPPPPEEEVKKPVETKPAEEPKPEPPPPPKAEEPKPEPPKPEPPKPEVAEPIPTPPDATNKLSAEEMKRRALDELLRQQEKFAKQRQAEEKNPLAVAAEALQSKGVLGGGKGGASFNKYGSRLKKAVQPHYNIPEVYRMRATEYVVTVVIAVSGTGGLMHLEVERSSGDQVFDDIVLQAIRNSVPLPVPPPDLAGERIQVNFSP